MKRWVFTATGLILGLGLVVKPINSVHAPDSTSLISSLEVIAGSGKPGSALALRNINSNQKIRACFRQECLMLGKGWSLFATDPEQSGQQRMLIEDDRGNKEFLKITLERNIFEINNRQIVQLRLPAQVVQRLKAGFDNIETDRAENASYFALVSTRTFGANWLMPMKSEVTSEFGSIRIAPEGQPYAHSGVDQRARQPKTVHAVGDGYVLGADNQILSGQVVTIDHGQGVISRYLHLSKFEVKPGEQVKAGQPIGLSGATGRVEAPHLHWEMRIRGRPVDPPTTVHLLEHLAGSG